jgi:hypothetical protein
VTNADHDCTQLASTAVQAQRETGTAKPIVIADRGYFSGTEIQAYEEWGVTPLIPKPITFGKRAQGLFDKRGHNFFAAVTVASIVLWLL